MNFPATPIDLFHVPSSFKGDVQIFHAHNSSSINHQQWIKPRGTNMTYMVAIGGGGGGGGGHGKTTGTNGGGGGGGACSGIANLLVPSFLLPDRLYVQVGIGGAGGSGGVAGGAAATAGGAGTNSYIMYSPLTFTAADTLLSSNTNAPGGGGAGTLAAVGAAGSVPTIATNTVEGTLGQFSAVVGLAGGAGGAVAGGNGTSITAWGTLPLTPGAGGGGNNGATNFDGGAITPTAATNFGFLNFSTAVGSIAASGSSSAGIGLETTGSAGISLMNPFFQSGGAGGGTNNVGAAGAGGRAGIGCGGGGGGAGNPGGQGGSGGNGLVAIFSW